jgi:hypothetical protein
VAGGVGYHGAGAAFIHSVLAFVRSIGGSAGRDKPYGAGGLLQPALAVRNFDSLLPCKQFPPYSFRHERYVHYV